MGYLGRAETARVGPNGQTCFYVFLEELWTNTEGNYSRVRWHAGINILQYDQWYSNAVRIDNVYVNGSIVMGSTTFSNIWGAGDHELGSGELDIGHDGNGAKSFDFSISGWLYANGSYSASNSVALSNIPRQANMTNAYDFNDEESPHITFTNPGNFSIDVWLEPNPNGEHLCIRKNIPNTGEYTWSLTDDERKKLRQKCTGNSCTVRFGIYTHIGNTDYPSYIDRTMSIVNATPEISAITFSDINEETKALTNNNGIIRHASIARVTIAGATAKKEATLKKFRVIIGTATNEVTFDSEKDTFPISIDVSKPDDNVITVYAIDSRNNTGSTSITISNYIEYIDLYEMGGSISATREPNNVGTTTNLAIAGKFWNGNFTSSTSQTTISNDIESVTYQYKRTTLNRWNDGKTTINPDILGGQYSFSDLIKGDLEAEGFNIRNSYDIKVIIKDKVSTLELTGILNSGKPGLAFSVNGVSAGAPYNKEEGGSFQVDGINIYNLIDGRATTLYEDTDGVGTNGSVTLSDSCENYSKLEIQYYRRTSWQYKVYEKKIIDSPNKKYVPLVCIFPDINSDTTYFCQYLAAIENYSIRKAKERELEINSNGVSVLGDNSEIYIYKVIGFKNVEK